VERGETQVRRRSRVQIREENPAEEQEKRGKNTRHNNIGGRTVD